MTSTLSSVSVRVSGCKTRSKRGLVFVKAIAVSRHQLVFFFFFRVQFFDTAVYSASRVGKRELITFQLLLANTAKSGESRTLASVCTL